MVLLWPLKKAPVGNKKHLHRVQGITTDFGIASCHEFHKTGPNMQGMDDDSTARVVLDRLGEVMVHNSKDLTVR